MSLQVADAETGIDYRPRRVYENDARDISGNPRLAPPELPRPRRSHLYRASAGLPKREPAGSWRFVQPNPAGTGPSRTPQWLLVSIH